MLRRAFQATENLGSLTVVLASELQIKGWHRFFGDKLTDKILHQIGVQREE